MATNLELKARIPSPDDLRERASRLGARPAGLLEQRDTYFRVPRGRLKLRECTASPAELIFYEREETSGERWSRYERVPVVEPEALKAVLALAGGILAVVEKRRTLFLFRNARIHSDEVTGLGTFLEFEIVGGESPDARALMKLLREHFGIREEMVVRGSYADLIIAKNPAKEY
jgi:adenylate cyclase, class 2